jgi:hypothetical protein
MSNSICTQLVTNKKSIKRFQYINYNIKSIYDFKNSQCYIFFYGIFYKYHSFTNFIKSILNYDVEIIQIHTNILLNSYNFTIIYLYEKIGFLIYFLIPHILLKN